MIIKIGRTSIMKHKIDARKAVDLKENIMPENLFMWLLQIRSSLSDIVGILAVTIL